MRGHWTEQVEAAEGTFPTKSGALSTPPSSESCRTSCRPVRLAISSPGFPIWLLTHFTPPQGDQNIDEVMNRLSAHLAGIDGPLNEDVFAPLIGKYQYARTAAVAAAGNGGAASTIYEFVDSMYESVRDYHGPGFSMPVL